MRLARQELGIAGDFPDVMIVMRAFMEALSSSSHCLGTIASSRRMCFSTSDRLASRQTRVSRK